MKLFRVFTPRVGVRKETYLGHWYAPDADAARKLALAYREEKDGEPYKRPVDTAPAVSWDKAFNSENPGGPPKPMTPDSPSMRKL
jgi:hypothetical protein